MATTFDLLSDWLITMTLTFDLFSDWSKIVTLTFDLFSYWSVKGSEILIGRWAEPALTPAMTHFFIDRLHARERGKLPP